MWATVLDPAAEHGWKSGDLNTSLPPNASPRWPLAYMRTMLARVDLAWPPHLLDQAAAEMAERDRLAQAAVNTAVDQALDEHRRVEDERRRAGLLTGTGRQEALAAAAEVGERARTRTEPVRSGDLDPEIAPRYIRVKRL